MTEPGRFAVRDFLSAAGAYGDGDWAMRIVRPAACYGYQLRLIVEGLKQ
ncbi:MAG: hypothetical protein AAGD92_04685 [Pseudomonadota bacterium]